MKQRATPTVNERRSAQVLRANCRFRSEAFGVLAFNPYSEEYFLLSREAGELLKYVNSHNVGLSDLETWPALANTCRQLLRMGVLRETASTEHGEEELPAHPGQPGCLSFPTYIDFYPTFRCNERCSFCYVGDQLDAWKEHPPMDEVQIDRFAEVLHQGGLFMLTVLGGEPFLYPLLPSLLSALTRRPLRVSLSTNGTIWREDVLAIVRDRRINLNVAYHSHRPEVNDRLTGHRGSSSKVEKFIEGCAGMGIPVHVTAVCSEHNIGHLSEHVEHLVRNLGVRVLTLNHPQRSGYATRNRLHISFRDFAVCYGDCRRIGEQYGAEVYASSYFNFLLPGYTGTYSAQSALSRLLYGCAAGLSKVEILPNGDVFPCSFLFSHREYRIGNLFAEDVVYLWRTSPILLLFRERSLAKLCADCPYAFVCRGGTICENLLTSGVMAPPQPRCPLHEDCGLTVAERSKP